MAIQPMWVPDSQRIADSHINRFRAFVQETVHVECRDFASLYEWSLQAPAEFWSAVWNYCGVVGVAGRPAVDDLHRLPGANWFPSARLNFAENLLRFRDDQLAIIAWDERGRRRATSFQQLHDQVSRVSSSLRKRGLRPGDRVAGYLPNIPEAVVAMLATTAAGGIWSSCSPDFGPAGLLDRFGQIEAKFLLTADAYIYNGKVHQCLDRLASALPEMPAVEQVVVIPHVEEKPRLDRIQAAVQWSDLLAADAAELVYERLPFSHPLYILYSSGTTGRPKCIVHGAGGTLLQHLKELMLHTDLKRSDRILYYTTCGWMMWNWLVSALAVGSTVLLYDGAPFHPQPNRLFDVVESDDVTVFGTSAKYLSAAEKEGLHPIETHKLSGLRTILSTGSPLAPESFDYVYAKIKGDVCLSSISGGTDIISCFALGSPVAPVYRGQLQTRGLGMQVAVYDEAGEPVRAQKGELVCEAAFPSMPLGFWQDANDRLFHKAYFSRYPGVWHHGDYAELTEQDGMIIYGRSDATLNPGGVRIGTAEIYRQVEQLEEVLESIVVGQEHQGDVRIVLFVKLRPGRVLDGRLTEQIKSQIRSHATPRHVPERVIQVPDIPRTKSGKIVELAVREVIHGRPVSNIVALANPEALEHFKDRAELG